MSKSLTILLLLLTIVISGTPIVYAGGNYWDAYVPETQPETQPESQDISIRDPNSAPSMGGFSARNNANITFIGAHDVIFLTTNTEIFIMEGKATQQYVFIFFDGEFIDTIDVGVDPKTQGDWLSIGGKIADIPFDVFYSISSDGHLIHKGAGYQHVFIDLQGVESQITDD